MCTYLHEMVKILYTSSYENDFMDAILPWMLDEICMETVQSMKL